MGGLAEDDDGYLYDQAFRQMIGKTSRVDTEVALNAEVLRAVALAGKVVSHHFEEALRNLGVTYQQFRAMVAIRYSGGGIQMHGIAAWLDVTPRTVTAIVDALEALALVERVHDPDDRRVFIVRLSEDGERRAAQALRVNSIQQRRVMGRLTSVEKRQLRHLSLKLMQAAQYPPEAPTT
jgi:DNA-binding MarR family transcriptional regulator